MKKLINIQIMSPVLAIIFMLGLSFTVNAEDMKLQEAKEKIVQLELENKSLKEQLGLYDKKIAEHKKRLAEFDNMDMSITSEE